MCSVNSFGMEYISYLKLFSASSGVPPSCTPKQKHNRGVIYTWWHHDLETLSYYWPTTASSNGNIFRVTGLLCGNSPVTGEFPTQRPAARSFDVFFDLHLYKRLSKQWWGWWFETPSRPLWRHCNAFVSGIHWWLVNSTENIILYVIWCEFLWKCSVYITVLPTTYHTWTARCRRSDTPTVVGWVALGVEGVRTTPVNGKKPWHRFNTNV